MRGVHERSAFYTERGAFTRVSSKMCLRPACRTFAAGFRSLRNLSGSILRCPSPPSVCSSSYVVPRTLVKSIDQPLSIFCSKNPGSLSSLVMVWPSVFCCLYGCSGACEHGSACQIVHGKCTESARKDCSRLKRACKTHVRTNMGQ
jgi:hypothetical protein